MLTPPTVLMKTDADLSIGEFGIATRMVQPEGRRGPQLDAPAPQVEPGATMIYKAKAPQPTEAASPAELGVEHGVVLAEDERPQLRDRGRQGRAGALEGLRRAGRGRERLAPARRAAPRGLDVVARRPGLDERHRAERQARAEGASCRRATRSRSAPRTSSSGRRAARESSTSTRRCSILKVAFIVLLYLFIWRIVRSASRDFRTGPGMLPAQESVLMRPTEAASLGLASVKRARLVVIKSPALDAGEEVPVDSMPVAIGRGGQNEIPLDGDEFASAQHARFESRRDGLWVEDIGSTNGTFVNGARVTTPRRLLEGRRRARRPDRLPGGGLMVGRMAVVSDTGPPPAAERGRLRLRAAALRRRRRDGRRAGRRGRVAASPRRCSKRAPGDERGEERVASLIQEANRRVFQRSNEDAATSGNGHDDDRRARRQLGRHDRLRPRRRLARVPRPRRHARAAHRRPFARRRARSQRQALAGGGGDAPAALGDHAGARHRAGRRRGHVHGRGPSRTTSTCSARTG